MSTGTGGKAGPAGFPGISQLAPYLLAAAIVISAIVTMYLGRGSTFTGDEMVWIVSSPGMDPGNLFQSHGGHLQLIPRGIYKLMLETVGLEYWPYRLLTVITTALASVLLYRFLSRRTGPAVALIPSVVMLIFGSDPLHSIRGNGFTIVFSIACGIAALLALDRRDLKGDAAACLLLVLGAATYTVALPFVVGAGLLLLLEKGWKRLWVPIVPLALYGTWRIWLMASGSNHSDSTLVASNVTDVPRWIFDALSAILSALTGLGYGFTQLSAAGPDNLFGPVLALLALAAIAWRISRGSIPAGLWVTLAIGGTLWAIQALVADPSAPDFRGPDDPRYMYPGAIVVIMIGGELVSGKRWPPAAFLALVAVGLFGTASNITQMREYGSLSRAEAQEVVKNITSAAIYFDEIRGARAEPPSEPEIITSTAALVAAMAQRPYGGIDYSEDEVAALPEAERASIDRQLAGFLGLKLARADVIPRSCAALKPAGDGTSGATLPPKGATLTAGNRSAAVMLGRFGDEATVDLGEVPPRSIRRLNLPEPVLQTSWRISTPGPKLRICRPSS